MIVKINPSAITGTIKAPASKSSMQRACALALLANGQTTIYNAGHSNDDLAALEIIKKLGATIEVKDDELHITGADVNEIEEEINCGESGLGIRMFAPVTALSPGQFTINGTGSLLKRPMHFFGLWGTLCFMLGFGIFLWLTISKFFFDVTGLTQRPLFFFALMLMIIGTQMFLAGFLGELVSRNAADRNNYLVEKKLGV